MSYKNSPETGETGSILCKWGTVYEELSSVSWDKKMLHPVGKYIKAPKFDGLGVRTCDIKCSKTSSGVQAHGPLYSESNDLCSCIWVNMPSTSTFVSSLLKPAWNFSKGDLNVQLSLSRGKLVSQLPVSWTGSHQPCPCGHFQSDSLHSEWCMTHYLGD